MQKNDTALFEVASVPPSRYNDEMENGACEAEFNEIESQLNASKSEE